VGNTGDGEGKQEEAAGCGFVIIGLGMFWCVYLSVHRVYCS
jgi:hypothetical protein